MYHFALSPHFGGNAFASAAAGGVLLGCTVIFRTLLLGQVLGVSGITRGLLQHPEKGFDAVCRAAFLLGLVLAGAIMANTYGGLEPMPPSGVDTVKLRFRCAVGGFLVGLGTAFGNGCTSGHGLTGLARLSWRSWVAVPLFMGSAVVTASATQTGLVLPADAGAEASTPSWRTAAWLSAVLSVFLLLTGAVSVLLRRSLGAEKAGRLRPLVELISGLAFGAGLVISSMSRPSKVANFLDLGAGGWDLSLALVMCGALLFTFPFFQYLERRAELETPSMACCWELPPKSGKVDCKLVLGSVCFGVGWGTCGMCPGPAWVLLGARPSVEVVLALLGIIIGLIAWVFYQKWLARKTEKAPSGAVVEPLPSDERPVF